MAASRQDLSLIHQLRSLQDRVATQDREDWQEEEGILFEEVGDLVQIEYYGDTMSESFLELIDLLYHPEVAAVIQSLTFLPVDQGVNGTMEWNFTVAC
jgi:hypothetical protein